MKHISILALNKSRINSLDNPRHAFEEVNDILISRGEKPLFKVQLVGINKEVSLNDGLYKVYPDILLKNLSKTDLIIVPALEGDLQTALKENLEFIPWIVEQYQNGSEVASLCVGAFLLAATGLLKGKNCSTHWRASNSFDKLFPDVNLVVEQIITDDKGIYSSGGAFSSANLILYIIEKYANHEIAILIAKIFQIDLERSSQSPFIIFSGQKDHKDNLILSAQNFIEENYKDKITIDDLAERFNIGRRTFERRFKKATSNTIIEYAQRVKVEAAKVKLEKGRKTVTEIMYDVGYSDSKSFRDVFKKFAGMSPLDYRNRFN